MGTVLRDALTTYYNMWAKFNGDTPPRCRGTSPTMGQFFVYFVYLVVMSFDSPAMHSAIAHCILRMKMVQYTHLKTSVGNRKLITC